MWIFKLLTNEQGRIFYLTPEKREITVGRSNVNLVLENDSSISRKHCSLHIAKKEDCPADVKTKTGIWVVDLGSKYGTYIKLTDDFKKITPNEPCILQHGCFIRFGIIENVWSVEYKPILALCNSTISSAARMELKNKLSAIGGDLMPFCDHRTSYLVANSYSLTEKVLLALINGVPLVTPAFVVQLMQAIENNTVFPDPLEFQPELKEIAVRVEQMILEPGYKRDKLFTSFHFFVTCPDRLQHLKPIVDAAGGKISVFQETDKAKLLQDGIIVLETFIPDASQLSQASNQLKAYLERHGKRTVPDREIPLAIAYNSTEKLCNVNCTEFSVRSGSQPLVPYSQCTVLEENTQVLAKKIQSVVEGTTINVTSIPESQVEEGTSEDRRQSIPESAPASSEDNRRKASTPDSAHTSSNVQGYLGSALDRNIANLPKPPEEICRPPSLVPSQNLNRKRVGSLDIFDEENPKKKALSQTKVSVPSNILQSPISGTSRSSIRNDERPPSSSQISIERSTSQFSEKEENPFGKRKAIPKNQESSYKRSRTDIEIDEQQLNKNYTSDNDVAPIFATPQAPPRLQPKPKLGAKVPVQHVAEKPLETPKSTTKLVLDTPSSTLRRSPPPCDGDGWIDMSNRKDGHKTPGDALSTTIVMLSLVTMAPPTHLNPGPGPGPELPQPNLRNVKIFKKQSLPEFNRTVDLQSFPDFQDDWLRITNRSST